MKRPHFSRIERKLMIEHSDSFEGLEVIKQLEKLRFRRLLWKASVLPRFIPFIFKR